MGLLSILLKRPWFAPDSSRRSPLNNPHQVPSSWKDRLPSTAIELVAEILTEEVAKKNDDDGAKTPAKK